MLSTFENTGSTCVLCNNQLMKSLGTLQGVFGAQFEITSRKITVDHTDEISSIEIAQKLKELGWQPKHAPQSEYVPPSEWGCAF